MLARIELGHIVLNVRNLEASTRFYRDVLGLKEAGRNDELRIAFLTFGACDHDVGLREAGAEASLPEASAIGLRHVAFRIDGGLEALRSFKSRLEQKDVSIKRVTEHVASTSIYFSDPDGIEIEVYIDARARPDASQKRFARPARIE